MLPQAEAQALFDQAMREFAPGWERVGELTEVTLRDPEHWLSGVGTFGVILRHRTTEALKVLGRRKGPEGGATYHRGISFLVLQAYAERNTDPMRRYLQEIGIPPAPSAPRRVFRAG